MLWKWITQYTTKHKQLTKLLKILFKKIMFFFRLFAFFITQDSVERLKVMMEVR